MNEWSPEQFWLKAKAYIDRANAIGHSSPDFAFWSSLSLEFLARAALTTIHPVLNADPREDVSLLHAFGYTVPGQPKSLPVHAVYLRLEKTVPGFGKTQRVLCDYLALLRNQELHTAGLPFDSLPLSKWLSRFYECCDVFCSFMKKTLNEFLGSDVEPSARQLIQALATKLKSEVEGRVAAHKKVFDAKGAPEREQLAKKASGVLLFAKHNAVEKQCPACGSKGLASGSLIKELPPMFVDDGLRVDQEYIASAFECLACGLVLKSLEELSVVGMEPRFTKRRRTELHELHEPDYEPEYDNM